MHFINRSFLGWNNNFYLCFVIFFQYLFMNINTNNPILLFRNVIKGLLERLTQNPEFYNIKHYTKNKGRKHNQQRFWWCYVSINKPLNLIVEFTGNGKEWLCYCKIIAAAFTLKSENKIFLTPFKSTFMKTKVYQKKTGLSMFLSTLSKNFIALFESGNKKEFQRLKDFITS